VLYTIIHAAQQVDQHAFIVSLTNPELFNPHVYIASVSLENCCRSNYSTNVKLGRSQVQWSTVLS